LGQDFEARGRSAPSIATAAGIQTAAVYAFAFMLLLAGTDDAGLLARAMRAWIAVVDPYLRWLTFFGLVPSGGPDGHLAVMHRHLLAACVLGVAVFVIWTRGYRGIWAQQLLIRLLRVHRTEARLRRIGVSARRRAALGTFGAALLVLLPSGGTGVGWYFFLAPLASGTVSYCLTHFIILGRLADESSP
jgi:hypothetical protein